VRPVVFLHESLRHRSIERGYGRADGAAKSIKESLSFVGVREQRAELLDYARREPATCVVDECRSLFRRQLTRTLVEAFNLLGHTPLSSDRDSSR
jgi:hypothetical protein